MSALTTKSHIDGSRQLSNPSSVWTWPRNRNEGEPDPDARLLGRNIAGMKAKIACPDGTVVEARVRTISQHDVVLTIADPGSVPVEGQAVELTLLYQNWDVLPAHQAIVHWSGDVYGQHLVGLFTVEALGEVAEQWQSTETRGEVRFPILLSAAVQVSQQMELPGLIMDYSLSGCRFQAADRLELDVIYPFHVQLPHRRLDMSLRARWIQQNEAGYQMGCTFQQEQGVLLACRHHAAPGTHDEPLTSDWDSLKDVDFWR
ncbi:MAG: PilZ domain-containing protein [Planctomycetaceae bacterium]